MPTAGSLMTLAARMSKLLLVWTMLLPAQGTHLALASGFNIYLAGSPCGSLLLLSYATHTRPQQRSRRQPPAYLSCRPDLSCLASFSRSPGAWWVPRPLTLWNSADATWEVIRSNAAC